MSRMVSNNNESRRPNRRRIVDLVSTSTAAAIIFISVALLSTTHPSAYALVAPSASPQHRPLLRIRPPSPFDRSSPTFHLPIKPEPRGDRTVRRYIDERIGADECIGVDAKLVFHPVESTTPSPASPPLLLRLFRALCALRAQVKTIKKNDRQLYFNFVENQSLYTNLETESTLPTGFVEASKERTNRK